MTLFYRISIILLVCIAAVTPPLVFAGQGDEEWVWDAESAVDYALQNNADSRIALIRIARAQAAIDQADSALYPRLLLNSEYAQTDNALYSFGNILNQGSFDNSIDFNDPGRTDNLRIQAELQYRLYSGGKVRAAIALSEHDRQKVIADRESLLNQLAFEVVRAFEQIVLAEEMVEARKSAQDAIKASLHVARARYDAGDLLRRQLLDLEVQEARAGEDLILARHTLNLTHHAFNNLLGIADGPVQIDRESSFQQSIPEIADYSARPELKSIESDIAAAGAAIQMSRAQYLPEIDGFAGYQHDTGFVSGDHGNSLIAGVRLKYFLFDGGRRDGELAEKKMLLAELEELQRKTELQLNYELQQAKQELQQARERVEVTKKMINFARESARLSRARFKEGVILSSDLIDSETRLTDALVRASRANALHKIAIANLRKVVGLPQF